METVSHLFSLYAYLQQTYRSLQIHRFNRQITPSKTSSILHLPDEILLIIFDLLEESDQQSFPERRHERFAPMVRRRGARQCKVWSGTCSDFATFSTTNRRIRYLSEHKLFRTVSLGESWSPERASKALAMLEKSSHASQYVKELKLDIWDSTGTETLVAAHKLLKFGQQFVLATQKLQNVRRMTLALPASTACALHYAFRVDGKAATRIQLPNVKELNLSPFTHWIIDFCPNVRSVESNDWVIHGGIARHDQVQAIIDAAGRAPVLEHFALFCHWRLEVLELLVEKIPRLKSLTIRGGQYCPSMRSMLSVLSKMGRLETLGLPEARVVCKILQLDGCVSPYLADEATSFFNGTATRKVFGDLWQLKRLHLGSEFKARLASRCSQIGDVRQELDVSSTCPDKCKYYQEVRQWGGVQKRTGEWVRTECQSRAKVDAKQLETEEDEEEQLRLLQEEMSM